MTPVPSVVSARLVLVPENFTVTGLSLVKGEAGALSTVTLMVPLSAKPPVPLPTWFGEPIMLAMPCGPELPAYAGSLGRYPAEG